MCRIGVGNKERGKHQGGAREWGGGRSWIYQERPEDLTILTMQRPITFWQCLIQIVRCLWGQSGQLLYQLITHLEKNVYL
jgi:hypothetical protein